MHDQGMGVGLRGPGNSGFGLRRIRPRDGGQQRRFQRFMSSGRAAGSTSMQRIESQTRAQWYLFLRSA
jgi:hypothetical protein